MVTGASTITISLPPSHPRSYDIVIGSGVLGELGPRAAALTPGRRAFVIADDGLPASLVETALASLRSAGFEIASASIHARESAKTLDTVSRLLHAVASTRHERRDPVIALGGGITGDIAGFVAAVWRRGAPVIQCPTTLLSMVDASVGGKTGANIRAGAELRKNMIGAFWQPTLVLADIAALASLSERHRRSGLAECLKHALLSHATDPDLLQWTTDRLAAFRRGETPDLAELIRRNVAVKASFVRDDEREEKPSSQGGRALLNLGHTFAHAIETIEHLSPDGSPGNAPLQHGEAVALGLVAAAAASHAMGRLTAKDWETVRVCVERLGLESRLVGLPPDERLLDAMGNDKKVQQGRLRLVLPVALNRSVVVEDPPMEAVRAGLAAIRA